MSVTVVVWVTAPSVAVMVTVLVPVGVPGMVLACEPPQAAMNARTMRIAATSSTLRLRLRRFVSPRKNHIESPNGAMARYNGRVERLFLAGLTSDAAVVVPVVVMVRVVDFAEAPGVNVAGLNEQEANDGNPEQEKLTTPSKFPLGVSVSE